MVRPQHLGPFPVSEKIHYRDAISGREGPARLPSAIDRGGDDYSVRDSTDGPKKGAGHYPPPLAVAKQYSHSPVFPRTPLMAAKKNPLQESERSQASKPRSLVTRHKEAAKSEAAIIPYSSDFIRHGGQETWSERVYYRIPSWGVAGSTF
jgi:hypothetical protein